MNRQPFQIPPRSWEPRISPWWIRLCRRALCRTLYRKQRIANILVEGVENLRPLLEEGAGVLIIPNHSFHYDSYVLIEVAHRIGQAFHFLTAWQVFAMSSRFQRWSLQRHGCFSIDREGNDLQAFKQAVAILESSLFPLVVFPEGDIYHTNDRVTPFREGAAAMGLTAARRAKRRIVAVPCALKCWYVDDPTPALFQLMEKLEAQLHWRPRRDRSLPERIYRFADGLITLKELEYRGRPQVGSVQQRTASLVEWILHNLEQHHQIIVRNSSIPDRVKDLRQHIIRRMREPINFQERVLLGEHMEDLFLVIQLYSYPGDYVAESQTVERIAETLDKFEEDVLGKSYPSVRGSRRVTVRFGAPIEFPSSRGDRDAVGRITNTMHNAVQQMLDDLNRAATSLPRSW